MVEMQGIAPGADDGSDDVVDALVQASFATMAVLTRIAGERDLSLTQLRVLAILRDRRLRMTALADHLGLEKSTMSGLVDRATRRGLLVRTPSETDGRAVDVTLTDAGAELVRVTRLDIAGALAPYTDALTARQQVDLQTLLERMLAPDGSPT